MRKLLLLVFLAVLATTACRSLSTTPSDAETLTTLGDLKAMGWGVIKVQQTCAIQLQPIDDPVGFGREWYRVVFVGPEPPDQVPSFSIDPVGTWLEQWTEDPLAPGPGRLAWFTGPEGSYTLTAVVPCGGIAKVTVTLTGGGH